MRPMATTQERLDYYLACEEAIVSGGEEFSWNGRRQKLPGLDVVTRNIATLQRQLVREARVAQGGGSLDYSRARFTGRPCG